MINIGEWKPVTMQSWLPDI